MTYWENGFQIPIFCFKRTLFQNYIFFREINPKSIYFLERHLLSWLSLFYKTFAFKGSSSSLILNPIYWVSIPSDFNNLIRQTKYFEVILNKYVQPLNNLFFLLLHLWTSYVHDQTILDDYLLIYLLQMLLLTCPIYFLFLSNIPPLIHLSALIFAMLIYANMLSLDCSTFRPVKLGVFNRCLFATMINPIYSVIVYIVTQLHTTSTVKCVLLAT